MSGTPGTTSPHYEDSNKDRARIRKRTFKKSPCGRPPEQPYNLRGAFIRSGSGRHSRIKARLRWREVTEDTSGFVIRIKHYVVEMEYTPNGADWFLADRWLAGKRYPSSEGRLTLTAATNPSGTTFRYVFSGNHGLDSDDSKITIRGCDPQLEYNGTFNITSVVNNTTVEVNSGGASGVAACTNPGWGEALQELYNWNPDKPHTTYSPVHKALGYRFRARAVAQDDCRSAWSDWKVIGNPGTDEPPAPTLVTVVDRDKHMRVTLSWIAEEADDDSDLFDDRINHFVAEISKNSGFSTIYKKDRGVKGQRISFRIDDADANDTFYGRVRSVSSDRDKSAWIPAKLAPGNSDSGAQPDGVQVGTDAPGNTKQPKAPTGVSISYDENDESKPNGRWRAKVIWNEVVKDVDNNDIDIDSYVVNFQQSVNGTTWTNDPRRVVVSAKDDDLDVTAYRIFHNINQKKFYRARVRAISETNTKGLWSSWTGDGSGPSTATVPTPINVTVKHKTRGKDRVVIDWDAPVHPDDADLPDTRVDFFQVGIKKNSTTPTNLASLFKFDRMTRTTEHTFTVPRADEDDTFYGWVRTVDVEGNKSAWISGTKSGNSLQATPAEGFTTDDGVKIGAIRKWAGRLSDGIPQGYLHCNGQTVTSAAYPDLYNVIGTRYGGSGTSFAVPDHRKRQGKGAGTGQNEGETENLSEGSRDEDHAPHPGGGHGKHKKHKHKHKHRHKHGQHGSGNTDDEGVEGSHTHSAGSLAADHSAPTGSASAGSGKGSASGTPTDLTRQGHTHNIPGHSITGEVGGGAASRHYHLTQSRIPNEANRTDGGHFDNATAPDGPSTIYDDSLTGLVGEFDGGDTDSTGIPLDGKLADDDDGIRGHVDHLKPADDDGVRGHKKHPFLRVHYIIKAV